jgi:hypothetical protein
MGLKNWLGTMQLMQARRGMDKVTLSFPDVLLRPKQVLVCLPGSLRELTLVKQFLPTITHLFKPADITLLSMPEVRLSDIYPRRGFQILTPTTDQVSWTGLPKKAYVEHLRSYKFDAVLDLSLQSSMFMSMVLLSFPGAIRIGRGNHLGEPFYNLEIKTRFLRDERNIYRSLLETLGQIMNKKLEGLTTSHAVR